MDLVSGTRLGRYEIRSKLGEGGMGEVYLAQDTKLERKVALKILPAEVASHGDRMSRFVREAKAASALNHPNIITIHEIEQIDSVNFIATEFIDGETLRQRMRNPAMRLGEVLDVAAQIASALAAAHAAGIVHRDIKPENIMARRDGIVKVLDFGLAKLTEQPVGTSVDTQAPTQGLINTEPGVVMGTAIYMSPEQARGIQVDARTDIFSLGVLIYEMIAGRLPFEGSNKNEIVASILSDKEPPPLARYAREVPAELERIVAKALRKNRDERYQNTKDLLLDLKTLKQRLEFEAELERSAPPSERAVSEEFRVPPSGGRPAEAKTLPPEGSTVSTRPASSVEYLISGIKEHKLATAIVLSVFLLAIGIGYWVFIYRSASVTTIDSIAVMPFENMTHEQNTEYLSDGVTESLINSLSQLPHIKVIARSSVFSYKNQTPNLQQVARQLNVQAVLTGRVLMQGDTLSVSVELTDTQNNTQLWGEHYTRKAADIFSVQDEIARQVTDALRVRLTGGQQEQVTKRYTENAEAYRLYLQGRYYFNQVSEENLNRAIPFFDQAIALDPHYALAYAARGESFFAMGDLTLPMSEAKRKVEQDIAAALSIDDKLAEARMLRANLEFQYDWDFARAEDDFKQVIALNPNYAEAHHQYGAFYLPMMGRPMEGVAEMKLAQQLDPVNPSINVDTMLPYYLARQFDQAIAQARKSVEMYPNFYLSHMTLGSALFQKGDYSTGIEELEKAKALEPTPLSIGILGYAYAKSGRKDEARKLLADLKEQSRTRYVASYWIAMIHVGLDEKDEAFAWLEKAYQERSWFLVSIKMDPQVDSLRSDSRFIDLMRRIGFPQ
jgi:serine/threonine protein kinase/tetratricopeptide (TPR) repeat protein